MPTGRTSNSTIGTYTNTGNNTTGVRPAYTDAVATANATPTTGGRNPKPILKDILGFEIGREYLFTFNDLNVPRGSNPSFTGNGLTTAQIDFNNYASPYKYEQYAIINDASLSNSDRLTAVYNRAVKIKIHSEYIGMLLKQTGLVAQTQDAYTVIDTIGKIMVSFPIVKNIPVVGLIIKGTGALLEGTITALNIQEHNKTLNSQIEFSHDLNALSAEMQGLQGFAKTLVTSTQTNDFTNANTDNSGTATATNKNGIATNQTATNQLINGRSANMPTTSTTTRNIIIGAVGLGAIILLKKRNK